jgi:hypothetical protein
VRLGHVRRRRGDTSGRQRPVVPGRAGQLRRGKLQNEEGVAFSKGAADIAWDVHSHDHSGGTKIHDKGTGGDGTVEFTAPEDGVFSVLWKNKGSTATPLDVSVTLDDGAALHSWMPE